MSLFDDDPFEEIVREFFGGTPRRANSQKNFIKGEREDRIIDFVEDDDSVYVVFELPGYDEKDVSVIVKNEELEISAKKPEEEKIQDYLHQKLKKGLNLRKKLPSFVKTKNYKSTMKNGVLEIMFMKSGGKK